MYLEPTRMFNIGTVIFQVIAFVGLFFIFYLLFLCVKALRKYLKS